MSITEELRKWWLHKFPVMDKELHKDFAAIADRIDAEHEECKCFCERIEEASKQREEVTLFGVDYIPLPVDADGEPIHVGDVMEVINSKQRAEACYMQMGPSGTWAVGLTKNCHWYDTESLRHHHAPTVEDVLREFVTEFNRDDTELCDDEVIERFASRLQLREDA